MILSNRDFQTDWADSYYNIPTGRMFNKKGGYNEYNRFQKFIFRESYGYKFVSYYDVALIRPRVGEQLNVYTGCDFWDLD